MKSPSEEKFVKIMPYKVLFKYNGETIMPAQLTIENTTLTRIAMKVKTNKPDLYIVKPNQSLIEAGSMISCEVCSRCDPKNIDLNSATHKFLFESVRSETNQRDITSILQDPNAEKRTDKLVVEFQKIEDDKLSPETEHRDNSAGLVESPFPAKKSLPTSDNERVESGNNTNFPSLAAHQNLFDPDTGIRKREVRESASPFPYRNSALEDEEGKKGHNPELLKDLPKKANENLAKLPGDETELQPIESGYQLFTLLVCAVIAFVLGYFLGIKL